MFLLGFFFYYCYFFGFNLVLPENITLMLRVSLITSEKLHICVMLEFKGAKTYNKNFVLIHISKEIYASKEVLS